MRASHRTRSYSSRRGPDAPPPTLQRDRRPELRPSSSFGTRGYGRMTGRKLALAGWKDAGIAAAGRKHHAVPLAAVLARFNHPLIAFPVERIVKLHPGIAVLDAELHRGPGRIALKRH